MKSKVRITLKFTNVVLAAISLYLEWRLVKNRKECSE